MGRRRRNRKQLDQTPREISIESMAHDGRGVGRDKEGKVVFVDFALPGERVLFRPDSERKSYMYGTTMEVLEASEHRVEARCEVFGQCGGCVLQHLDENVQLKYKQEQLLENFKKLGNVEPEALLPPLQGQHWGYRRRARLGAKFVPKKGGMIVGFRERNSSFIQPTNSCEVLYPEVSQLIPQLRDVLAELSCQDRIPQVEVTVADNVTALIIRHLEDFTADDISKLRAFARQQNVVLFLQPGNLKSVHPIYPEKPDPLFYRFEQFDIRVEFLPTDFIQVNASINEQLVAHAVDLLEVSE